MENLGYLLEDDDISPAVKRRSRTQTAASAQLENVSKTYLFVKRLADVVLSFLAVIVLSVPMLLIALAVFLPIRFGAPAMFYAEPLSDVAAAAVTTIVFVTVVPGLLRKREALLGKHIEK